MEVLFPLQWKATPPSSSNRHRGRGGFASTSPATPPGMRVRTGRFDGLRSTGKFGTPSRTTAGSTSPRLGHNSFAVTCPRSDALRFTSLAVTSLREDFYLQVNAHAGHTRNSRSFRYGSVGIGGCGDSQPPIPTLPVEITTEFRFFRMALTDPSKATIDPLIANLAKP